MYLGYLVWGLYINSSKALNFYPFIIKTSVFFCYCLQVTILPYLFIYKFIEYFKLIKNPVIDKCEMFKFFVAQRSLFCPKIK